MLLVTVEPSPLQTSPAFSLSERIQTGTWLTFISLTNLMTLLTFSVHHGLVLQMASWHEKDMCHCLLELVMSMSDGNTEEEKSNLQQVHISYNERQ